MRVNPIKSPNFGYKHPLKTQWLKGKLPTVTKGLYGEVLTPKTISVEHLTPASLGGGLDWGNVVLADRTKNSQRGIEPIENFVTVEMLRNYLKQFKDIMIGDFKGNDYIKLIRDYFKNVVENC